MVKITENKLRLTAKNKGTKDYENMSNKMLLHTVYQLKRFTKNLSKNEYNKIVKMQNLSLNELKQIEKMNNLSLNELKQIAKIRHTKKYNDMSKGDLLIVFLKSNKSHTELRKSKFNSTEIEKTKNVFNELRNNFLEEEIGRISRTFYVKESIDKYF